MPAEKTPEQQLAGFIGKYSPPIQVLTNVLLQRMRARLPGAVQLVYDNYNALVIGFGPSERAWEATFSLTLYSRWVSLFFLQAKGLADPDGLLAGSGTVARHIVLKDAEMLDAAQVRALMDRALAIAAVPIDPAQPGRLLIKSISAKQRPRRPAGK